MIKVTGLRRGEKLHEFITEDLCSQTAEQYTDGELVDLLRPYIETI
jgi:FlaA1/EpsC-like NDP-sugar epimerase